MGRASLIMVMGAMLTFSILNQNIIRRLQSGVENSVAYYTDNQLRNMNYATAQFLMSTLASTPSFRTTSAVTISLFDGTVTYSVNNAYFAGDSLVRLTINSSFTGVSKSITIYVNKRAPIAGVLPTAVKASISSRTNIATSGNLVVDGRDHDLNGNLISPSSGTKGVWTTGTLNQSGASTIGGYSGGTSYAPSKPGNAHEINTSQPATGVPTTPDEVLGGTANGYPEGKLKAIALSGAGGSQYVTDPATLTFPLRGVTYVELPSGSTWISSNIEGSGVLVVSNTARNAVMKNLNAGTFKGLLIGDDIVHLHTDVLGAIVTLTAAPSAGNVLGNGSGEVTYSSAAIKDATRQVMEAGNIGGTSAPNFGFGKTRLFLRYWYE